jgi:alpha-beta hydrolase superfamily lysophospholipase
MLPPARPTLTYADAHARFAAAQSLDDAAVNPLCRSYLLDHGQRTRRAVVYFHGYTNCPAQFRQLGEQFFRRGDNVLVPRLPWQGLADRMTPLHARLTADELAAATQEAVDIACGLGEEVIVMGLSAGAIMAGWAAQLRGDVHTALVCSPSLGFPGWPAWASDWLCRGLRRLPNLFIWWDRKARDRIAGAPHAYPRFATRSLSEIVVWGQALRRAAATAPPQAQQIVVIASAADRAAHLGLTLRLAADWLRHAPDRVRIHTFADALQIQHDMIDPTQPAQRADLVYPVLLDLSIAPRPW